MENRDLLKILQKTGYTVVYAGLDDVCETPYITYQFLYTNNSCADDEVNMIVAHWQITLYTTGKKSAVEKKLEELFNAHGMCWNKRTGIFEAKERILQTIYELEEIE